MPAPRTWTRPVRISKKPFVYLDKNYVRILGGTKEAVESAISFGQPVVVQVRGETASVGVEAIIAARAGASVIMVDTGNREDVVEVSRALNKRGMRSQVQLVFAGNILLTDIEGLAHMDVDIVDIGYAIMDAPCLPMRFDVVQAV